jgi:hypothetical protein
MKEREEGRVRVITRKIALLNVHSLLAGVQDAVVLDIGSKQRVFPLYSRG